MQDDQIVLGIVEAVSLPLLGVSHAYAKIDTGAYSGALHCESIEEIIHPATGKKALKIVPVDASHRPVIVQGYKRVYTTSSSGHRLKRYIIQTSVVIKGVEYIMSIGITKRHMMNFKILIGRRFLRRNGMLVDVSINAELDNDGGQKI